MRNLFLPRLRYMAIPAVIMLRFFTSCTPAVYEMQPAISWGGRVVSLTRSPSSDNDIIAAAESGGLFHSSNGGKSWTHLELPVFYMQDVKYAPWDPNVVVATSKRDLKKKNGGGVWWSHNGGKTWLHKQPSTVLPFANLDINGYGIAFEPGSQRIYVGTDKDIMVSEDGGKTWAFKAIIPGYPKAIYSILALGGGTALATARSGVYRTIDGGNTWSYSAPLLCTSNRALTNVPSNPVHVFLADDLYKINYSPDFGISWSSLDLPPTSNRTAYAGREEFVRCNSFSENGNPTTHLYFGDGFLLYRKPILNTSRSAIDSSAPWTQPGLDHKDPSDVIFDRAGNPLLLASDGGVHASADKGNNWNSVGMGPNGLNALQVNEAAAQEYLGEGKKPYVYFGTQDNSVWASSDGGATWVGNGAEGHSIETKRRALVSTGNLVTFALDGDSAIQWCADQGFVNVRDWKEPTNRVGDPIILPPYDLLDPAPQDRFLQLSYTDPREGRFYNPRLFHFNRTADGGSTWKRVATMFQTPSANPKAAFKNETVVYQPYGRGDSTKNGFPRIGLMRLSAIGSTPRLEYADQNGFGSLGVFVTEFMWYNVFAVNPSNPDHLMMPDIEDGMIKTSYDGGKNWVAEKGLTSIITGGGDYEFYRLIDCCPRILVTYIGFNPDDPGQIAIGTRENGIFFTWDGGNVWYQLKDTKQITNISSIVFYFDKTLLVSTYGRSLWKVRPQKSGIFSVQVARPYERGAWVWKTESAAIESAGGMQQSDSLRAVDYEGELTLTLQELISKRFISVRGSSNSDSFHLTLPPFNEAAQLRIKKKGLGAFPVRGFYYDSKHVVKGIIWSLEPYKIYTPQDLTVTRPKEKYVYFLNTNGKPLWGVPFNDTLVVAGTKFFPSRGKVRITINDSLFVAEAVVADDSMFHVIVPPLPYGLKSIRIRVSQADQAVIHILPVFRQGDAMEEPGKERR